MKTFADGWLSLVLVSGFYFLVEFKTGSGNFLLWNMISSTWLVQNISELEFEFYDWMNNVVMVCVRERWRGKVLYMCRSFICSKSYFARNHSVFQEPVMIWVVKSFIVFRLNEILENEASTSYCLLNGVVVLALIDSAPESINVNQSYFIILY